MERFVSWKIGFHYYKDIKIISQTLIVLSEKPVINIVQSGDQINKL